MKKTLHLILTLWISLLLPEAQAQETKTITIKGLVSEAQGKPVTLASVEIYRQADSVRMATITTNTSGSFEWKGKLPAGNYWLMVSHAGYQPVKVSLIESTNDMALLTWATSYFFRHR